MFVVSLSRNVSIASSQIIRRYSDDQVKVIRFSTTQEPLHQDLVYLFSRSLSLCFTGKAGKILFVFILFSNPVRLTVGSEPKNLLFHHTHRLFNLNITFAKIYCKFFFLVNRSKDLQVIFKDILAYTHLCSKRYKVLSVLKIQLIKLDNQQSW